PSPSTSAYHSRMRSSPAATLCSSAVQSSHGASATHTACAATCIQRTGVVTSSSLSPRSEGSSSSLATATVLVTSSTATSAGTASVTTSVADRPAASPSARTHSSVPPRPSSLAPVSSHTSPTAYAGSESSHVADTSSSSPGRVSVSVASWACAPPWFVTVIVYVGSSPPGTDSAAAVLTTRRSGESPGTRSSSTLSSRSVSVVEVVTVTRLVTSGNEAG